MASYQRLFFPLLLLLPSLLHHLCIPLCSCEVFKGVTSTPRDSPNHANQHAQKTQLINSLKGKTNQIRKMYNALNEKNVNLPLYLFANDNDEEKRQVLKDLFLRGYLDVLQGLNTPLSKYYLSMRSAQRAQRTQVEAKIRNERDLINGLSLENKKRHVEEKLREYRFLKDNLLQLYSTIEKRLKSVDSLMARLDMNPKN
ncbi:conserved Plasmodium protein, unknown function [Plasmodium knowlesi strain H]|uniref:Uncharacterized protein n=3 Tax=Plasmodium knowlesi TaxID=5850 RepID=A0A5K1USK3_PLAKH|nr:conserved protein, unknown function [Plasmodium knowlesi strain H]OTN64342.1 Uncharacterized protein PKNOH_S130212800 [Plasmodium knowlesi]CAA9989288.1 conserved protein, unknown function [Plasmodium knowlesi strain H]SBO26136.1 conserved Plasmodium protein, unknown function [Plasmodium knowlesi strain H]SBO26817.1 conserved Plasmodium protein, unknown function [Plasmodium knowlesi strain H]VVS78762.1 conserved protein, unknown function [Plasmodium knowlesi strain H]|eukprot:XP_002261634.1 hypothetical protein, conserved in Plasmodium species [Plasmodium knowlesi strain H]